MDDRSHLLLHIRPQIANTTTTLASCQDEQFQNLTLRPILKLQNDLLLAVLKNYIKKHKNRFFELPLEKRFDYIENAIQKDIKLRNSIKGMILGQFTVEEYASYIQNSSALNKRIMGMAITRLKDQIQLFEEVISV
ncbi:MAG: glyoxalase [Flavobacteriaceae bacterium]